MNLVPYSFSSLTLPRSAQGAALLGQVQGVYIALTSTDYQFILNKIVGWFADYDEVELIDHGVSDKQGLGYIILEWDGCQVDRLFLNILRDEEIVDDYTIYTRNV